jgi:hypothetical protein
MHALMGLGSYDPAAYELQPVKSAMQGQRPGIKKDPVLYVGGTLPEGLVSNSSFIDAFLGACSPYMSHQFL